MSDQRGFTNVGSASINQRRFHVELTLNLQRQFSNLLMTLHQCGLRNVESTSINVVSTLNQRQRCFDVAKETLTLFATSKFWERLE